MRRKQVLRRSWAFFLGNCFINILNYRLGGIRQEKKIFVRYAKRFNPTQKSLISSQAHETNSRAIELFHIAIELNTFSAQMKVTPQKKNRPLSRWLCLFVYHPSSSRRSFIFSYSFMMMRWQRGETHNDNDTTLDLNKATHNSQGIFIHRFWLQQQKKTKSRLCWLLRKVAEITEEKSLTTRSSLLKLPSRRTAQHTWYVPETWSIRYLNSSRVSLEIQRPIVSKFLLIRQFLS